jgi:perosamine synthetase
LTLHASGREALRVAFAHLAASTQRSEVAIPAYSCFSIPAAAVAAGLQVRLVDIGNTGQFDRAALECLPFEQIAAVVVSNLFGVPDAIEDVIGLAHDSGAGVIDDAAQTLGGRSPAGQVGARADIGILSFGRGKPLSALGGGALVWREAPPDDAIPDAAEKPQRWGALLRAAAYDAARIPFVLAALSAIPALGIGETIYDPGFPRGPMPGAALALAAALLPELDASNRSRAQRTGALAGRLTTDTDFTPILAAPGEFGIYPRLGVLAPTPAKRDAALAALGWLGATRMYPTPLDAVPALKPHLVGKTDCPGARDFCARLLTLPTHAGMHPRRVDQLVRILRTL